MGAAAAAGLWMRMENGVVGRGGVHFLIDIAASLLLENCERRCASKCEIRQQQHFLWEEWWMGIIYVLWFATVVSQLGGHNTRDAFYIPRANKSRDSPPFCVTIGSLQIFRTLSFQIAIQRGRIGCAPSSRVQKKNLFHLSLSLVLSLMLLETYLT